MLRLSFTVYLLAAWFARVSAECQSSGYDFVHGGGPDCINTTSSDWFSFGTVFHGCQPSDIQDAVTPILVAPNSDDYYCSDIGVTPDGENLVSTCNVPGDELPKSSVFSGDWTVIIEGLEFAWMRTFSIIAAPPVVFTSTPTVTFSVPYTPSTTITTTFTSGFTTTLPPATITVPSTTSTRTVTIRPTQVTVTSTITSTRLRTTKVYSKTVATTTTTTSCKTQPVKRDPTCTIHPSKATLAAASNPPTAIPRVRRHGRSLLDRLKDRGVTPRQEAGIVKRSGPDQCTTTVLETSTVISSYITVTYPASTELVSETVTTTATLTPTPITAYSGSAKTTITITAPTPTRTRTTKVYTTKSVTTTIWATITSTIKVPPPGVVCATSR